MRLKHRKLICIITSFIMAVTVFGCTSLTFALGENDVNQGTDELVTETTTSPETTTPSDNQGSPVQEQVQRGAGDNPAAPVKLKELPGDKTVTLEWEPVASTSGGDISYEIYDSAEATTPIDTTQETTWPKSDLSLSAGTYTYYVGTVETITVEGQDDVVKKSDERTQFGPLTVTDEAADKVAAFQKQKLTGLCSDPGYRAVLLEWNAVPGATGYYIYRRQGEERGTAGNSRGSDGRGRYTLQSGGAKRCYQKFQTGYSLIKNLTGTASTGKVTYRDGGLRDLNMTYVYFYQYVIVPYYKDAAGNVYYCKGQNGAYTITNTTLKGTIGTDYNLNTVKNNTVLPMYILYRAKKTKPYYRTNSMRDGKKMGKLSKGTYYLGFDKKDGRNRFYMAKGGRTEYWFAQKNANVLQGYYLYNGSSGDLSRKDWQTGYSKKTVLDYVNYSGLSSSNGKLIWVSKYAQHVYLFTGSKYKWKLINNGSEFVTTASKGSWSNLCATGKVLFSSRNNNGPIKGKQYRKKTRKYWYYNISKLHPSERLHSVLMKKKAGPYSGRYYDRTLGAPKSNGCIRLKPGAADFIYKWAPRGTKVFVY